MMQEKYVFGPLAHGAPDEFARADLEFYRIDHFVPTYVADIYFNDPDVDHDSGGRERKSFAGSFAVFGHPICHGDEGHCMVPPIRRAHDHRPPHHLTPLFKRVMVTEALRQATLEGDALTITILVSTHPRHDGKPFGHGHGHQQVFNVDAMKLVTYR